MKYFFVYRTRLPFHLKKNVSPIRMNEKFAFSPPFLFFLFSFKGQPKPPSMRKTIETVECKKATPSTPSNLCLSRLIHAETSTPRWIYTRSLPNNASSPPLNANPWKKKKKKITSKWIPIFFFLIVNFRLSIGTKRGGKKKK